MFKKRKLNCTQSVTIKPIIILSQKIDLIAAKLNILSQKVDLLSKKIDLINEEQVDVPLDSSYNYYA